MRFENEFLINYWYGIPFKYLLDSNGNVDRDKILDMKTAGFNHIDASYDAEHNKEILEIARELELYVTVNDVRISEAFHNPERAEQLIRDVICDYKDYPSLLGYHVFDEPSPACFETLGKIRRIISKFDPDHEAYINLFPNYAFPGLLGDIPYEEYVENFIKTVNPEILSFDNYHYMDREKLEHTQIDSELKTDASIAVAYNKVNRLGFLDNLEVIRNKGIEHDIPYMSIILVVEHGPYRNVGEGEIRWDVFHSLAYGCSRQCYFTYWTPGVDGSDNDEFWHWQNGMISKDGEKTEHYDIVKHINEELVKIGNELIGKKSLGVFYNGKSPESLTSVFAGYGCVDKIEGDDVAIGFFEGNYAVIANQSEEKECEIVVSADCTMDFYDPYEDEWISIDNADGKYALGLDAGDGILVRFISKLRK